jgi:hypothetical protein
LFLLAVVVGEVVTTHLLLVAVEQVLYFQVG